MKTLNNTAKDLKELKKGIDLVNIPNDHDFKYKKGIAITEKMCKNIFNVILAYRFK